MKRPSSIQSLDTVTRPELNQNAADMYIHAFPGNPKQKEKRLHPHPCVFGISNPGVETVRPKIEKNK